MSALQSESIAKLMPALVAAQQAFAPAVKNKTNPAFRSSYVDLEGVLDAVQPALLANGIALVQQPDFLDGETVLVSRLIHTSGEWLSCHYRVRPVKADPQGEGSALTYARRFSAMSLCGIAPEDDDGNAASQHPKPAAKPRVPPPTVVTPTPAAPRTNYGMAILAADEAQLRSITASIKADTAYTDDEKKVFWPQVRARLEELEGGATK